MRNMERYGLVRGGWTRVSDSNLFHLVSPSMFVARASNRSLISNTEHKIGLGNRYCDGHSQKTRPKKTTMAANENRWGEERRGQGMRRGVGNNRTKGMYKRVGVRISHPLHDPSRGLGRLLEAD